jgi:hypothetical protein
VLHETSRVKSPHSEDGNDKYACENTNLHYICIKIYRQYKQEEKEIHHLLWNNQIPVEKFLTSTQGLRTMAASHFFLRTIQVYFLRDTHSRNALSRRSK